MTFSVPSGCGSFVSVMLMGQRYNGKAGLNVWFGEALAES